MTKDPFNISRAEQATLSPEQLRALDLPQGKPMNDVDELRAALKWALPLVEQALEDCRQLRLKNGHSDIGAGTNRWTTDARTHHNNEGNPMTHFYPQRRPSLPSLRAGVWECPACECVNGPEDDLCWNCESTREGEKAEAKDVGD